jgi:alternate signal-mediated exported protein
VVFHRRHGDVHLSHTVYHGFIVVPSEGNIMNKLVKGSIAGAAGIALLLGGAGTFALWNDSVGVTSSNVGSGTLRITDTGVAGAWTDASATMRNGAVVTPASQKMVPGDTWTFTKEITVAATGKNLLADLTFDTASITATDIPVSELSYVFVATPASDAGSATVGSTPIATNTYRVTPGTLATTKFTVTFTIAYKDVPAGNVLTAQAKTIDLSGLKIKLTQVRPA